VLIAAFVVYQLRIKQIETKKKALEIRVEEKTEAAEALQSACRMKSNWYIILKPLLLAAKILKSFCAAWNRFHRQTPPC
jgi:hypothetical protein